MVRRRRFSRLSLFYAILVTGILVGGSLWMDRRGQLVMATVTGKTEEIAVRHEPQGGWYRHYRVGAAFDGAGAPTTATVTVDRDRFDSLRLGDSVAIRYLTALPLYARTADRSTTTVATDMVQQLLSSNLIIWAVLGLIAMVISAWIGMVPVIMTGLLWLVAGYAWILRSPATPAPVGAEATARVSHVTLVTKSPARRTGRYRRRAMRSDTFRRLDQPYQVVELKLPLPGRPDSLLAVDAVDSGSVAGLAVGTVLPVRHPPGDARGARLTAGTRTFGERNRYHYLPIAVGLPLLGMAGAYGFRRRRGSGSAR
jgi:hypothetical protein